MESWQTLGPHFQEVRSEKGREWEGRVERIIEFIHRKIVRNVDRYIPR